MNDEARKKLIYLVAGMLLCRKLDVLEGRPSPAREMAFHDAMDTATELMRRIEARFPEENSEFLLPSQPGVTTFSDARWVVNERAPRMAKQFGSGCQ